MYGNGLPIDKETCRDLIKETDSRISSVDYTTIEELEKEIANW